MRATLIYQLLRNVCYINFNCKQLFHGEIYCCVEQRQRQYNAALSHFQSMLPLDKIMLSILNMPQRILSNILKSICNSGICTLQAFSVQFSFPRVHYCSFRICYRICIMRLSWLKNSFLISCGMYLLYANHKGFHSCSCDCQTGLCYLHE